VSPDDLVHQLTRFGPFLLVIAWAAMVAIFRRRPARPLDPAAPAAPAPERARPLPAVPAPIAAAYTAVGRPPAAQPPSRPARRPAAPSPAPVISDAAIARAASVARVEARDQADAAEVAAQRLREQLVGVGWQRAVVLTEILGPPIAMRRPGTLGPPGAL
jgi:hypothetical protein